MAGGWGGAGARGAGRAGGGGDETQTPDTRQSLLRARIARGEEAARHTLQLASVIGRTFFYRVLQAIHETNSGLDRQLGTLRRVGVWEGEWVGGGPFRESSAFCRSLRC